GKEHLLDYSYLGKELDLFSRAENWKKYWSSLIAPHLNGTVIDVGAGIGANVSVLLQPAVRRLVCLEPDPVLGQQLRERISQEPLAARCERWQGTIHDLTDSTAFDAILYIDVLEHIEHDAAEVAAASRLLRPGGRLIVLAPAH